MTKNLSNIIPSHRVSVKMNSSIRSFQFEGTVEVKSKFDAEFRRFRLEKQRYQTFDTFKLLLCDLHHLKTVPFVVKYADEDNDLLPITNDDNYMAALRKAKPLLRLVIQREGEGYDDTRLGKSSTLLNTILGGTPKDSKKNNLRISNPKEFRQVSAIIDVDLVPETCRRVKLLKHGSDKPLGFYIRDGTSVRVTPQGLEKVPGIFISRYKKYFQVELQKDLTIEQKLYCYPKANEAFQPSPWVTHDKLFNITPVVLTSGYGLFKLESICDLVKVGSSHEI